MESIKKRLDRTFFKPQSNISRYISFFVIQLVGIGGIYIYFAIEYFLCADNRCVDLEVTKPWLSMTPLFVIYGLCSIIISFYLLKAKQLQYLYAWAIDVFVASSFVLISKAFFSIAIEIGKAT
ncbi:MAG: hypothetical protein AB2551_16365 [Candidatus Thiodiazotropha sp.]